MMHFFGKEESTVLRSRNDYIRSVGRLVRWDGRVAGGLNVNATTKGLELRFAASAGQVLVLKSAKTRNIEP